MKTAELFEKDIPLMNAVTSDKRTCRHSAKPPQADDLREAFASGKKSIGIYDTGILAGFYIFDPARGWGRGKDGVDLCEIHVRNDLRGKGYGTAMLDDLVKRAKKSKKSAISLFVRQTNLEAFRFYAENGFHVTGFLSDFHGPGIHVITMEKNI